MAIGSYEKVIGSSAIRRMIIQLFGVQDYHSHLRIKPLLKLSCKGFFDNKNVLEIGCGRGLNGYEIFFHSNNCFRGTTEYVGVDMSLHDINRANMIKEVYRIENMKFFNMNAFDFIEKYDAKKIDVVLLMDVLEHIEDDLSFLIKLNSQLRNNVIYVISSPTKIYPEVFGREFHSKIGHVRDGYDINELEVLFDRIDKRIGYQTANTYAIGSVGARLYYKQLYEKNIRGFRAYLMCLPFMISDNLYKNKPASIFAVFK